MMHPTPRPHLVSRTFQQRARLAAACVFLAACAAASDAGPPQEPTPVAATSAPAPARADSVHVSPLGDDANVGSAHAPLRTFAEAIAAARNSSRRLALCAGVFTEPLVLDAAKGADGFEVEGGVPCQGFTAAETVVRTSTSPALQLFALGGSVRIANVTFERANAETPGASSIAGTIAFVDRAVLVGVTLRAGKGADGAAGSTVSVDPCDEPIDPRTPTHVGPGGQGASIAGILLSEWFPAAGEDGGVLRFPRSSRCVEAPVLAGSGGMGGGASLALTVRSAHVELQAVSLSSEDAGKGGAGGHAQAPGCDPLTQKSCEVLDIGGGGGGAGGVSAGVIHRNAVFDIDASTRFSTGHAGTGGKGGRGARWLHGTDAIAGSEGFLLEATDLAP